MHEMDFDSDDYDCHRIDDEHDFSSTNRDTPERRKSRSLRFSRRTWLEDSKEREMGLIRCIYFFFAFCFISAYVAYSLIPVFLFCTHCY